MSVGGSFGGELTFACLEPRPARPRRKLEAECSRCGTYKRGGMLRQARFEFVRGQRRRTGVQGKPGPESVVVSGLCCVSTVVVNRCSEHLSEPRPGHNWKLADDLPETNRELAGLRGLPDRSSGVVDCGRVLYPLPQSTAVYLVEGRGFTPQTGFNQKSGGWGSGTTTPSEDAKGGEPEIKGAGCTFAQDTLRTTSESTSTLPQVF